MAIKRDDTPTAPRPDTPEARKVREVAEQFNRDADVRQRKDFGKLKQTTETLSLRVPIGERTRLRLLFARHGLTLAEGLKKALYEFAAKLEGKQ